MTTARPFIAKRHITDFARYPEDIKQLEKKIEENQAALDQHRTEHERTHLLKADIYFTKLCNGDDSKELNVEEKKESDRLHSIKKNEEKEIIRIGNIVKGLQEEKEKVEKLLNDLILKNLVNSPQLLLNLIKDATKDSIKPYQQSELKTPSSLIDPKLKNAIAAIERAIGKLPTNDDSKEVKEVKGDAAALKARIDSDLQDKCYQLCGFLSDIARDEELKLKHPEFSKAIIKILNDIHLDSDDCNTAKTELFEMAGQQRSTTYDFNIHEYRYKKTVLPNLRTALTPFEALFDKSKEARELISNANIFTNVESNDKAKPISDQDYLALINIFEPLTDLLNAKSEKAPITVEQRQEIEKRFNQSLCQQVSKLKMGLGILGMVIGGVIAIAGILALPVTLGISVLPLAAYNSIAVGSVTSAVGIGFFLSRNNYTDISKKALDSKRALDKIKM